MVIVWEKAAVGSHMGARRRSCTHGTWRLDVVNAKSPTKQRTTDHAGTNPSSCVHTFPLDSMSLSLLICASLRTAKGHYDPP